MTTRLANQFIAIHKTSYTRENERVHVAIGFACHRYIMTNCEISLNKCLPTFRVRKVLKTKLPVVYIF